jgi:hypothetical protein
MTEETFTFLLKDSVNQELAIGANDSFRISKSDIPDINFESGEEPQITLKDEIDDDEHLEEVDENKQELDGFQEDHEQDKELTRRIVTTKELKTLMNEFRGGMDKGKTFMGNEIMDFDMRQKWTNKFLKQVSKKFTIPKSIKKINFYSIDEDDHENVTGKHSYITNRVY